MSATQVLTTQTAPSRTTAAGYGRPDDDVLARLKASVAIVQKESFTAEKHLIYKESPKILTFADLKKQDSGISATAVSEPFELFSQEAIAQMRAEIFSDEVLENHYCQTGPSTGQVRGHCPHRAPFINSAWNSPEVLKIISKIAGVELVPAIDYDVGHVNISTNNSPEFKPTPPGEQEGTTSQYCESSFGWHTDSYPFVVVTMLSDCTGMVGGETAIRMGNGEILKARGPTLGTAVVMQGSFVEHKGTAALGGRERINMVTSFRPKSPWIEDSTILRGVRNISRTSELYAQYTEYQLDNMEERLREVLKNVRKRRVRQLEFETADVRHWLTQQRDLMEKMLSELLVVQ